METIRRIKVADLFRAFITNRCIFQRDSVVGKSAGAGSFQCLHIGQLFSFEGRAAAADKCRIASFSTHENLFSISDLDLRSGKCLPCRFTVVTPAPCSRQSPACKSSLLVNPDHGNECVVDQSRATIGQVGVDHISGDIPSDGRSRFQACSVKPFLIRRSLFV